MSIGVFLSKLVGFFFQCCWCFTGFYFFVFLLCIALSGNFDKTGIDDLACLSKDTLGIMIKGVMGVISSKYKILPLFYSDKQFYFTDIDHL